MRHALPAAWRHRLYRHLRPRAYRQGQLAEQRHQFLDLDTPLAREDYPIRIGGDR
ncbi:hypothetical protein I5Q34_08155 [Streptomyces sp. AV19]|uniref:hypothetical protein n=1 Tax=Streptomyces sp. AV19 TaxID=2793068 RepID=UPI0018FF0D3A|nr:hypothetical protein [Streptomyces sp. AV19]MBH1934267.1 hypothetical protein [Streptomyces sp. AV19]MDG4533423.1 hypothetical protein [Streptomyces sp. AV19]